MPDLDAAKTETLSKWRQIADELEVVHMHMLQPCVFCHEYGVCETCPLYPATCASVGHREHSETTFGQMMRAYVTFRGSMRQLISEVESCR